MAVPQLLTSEFIGWHKISQNQFTSEKVQDYIDNIYPDIIGGIIGFDAYYEIEEEDPLKDKWQFLFDGGKYVDEDGKSAKLIGLLEIAKGLIYFEFVRDEFQSTIVGKVKSDQENSNLLNQGSTNRIAGLRYNKSIRAVNSSLKCYLDNFKEVKEGVTNISNTVGTTYLIELPSTRYLYDGDTVEIGGAEYVVANLIADTSFEVDSSSAVSGDTAIWYPYEKVELTAPMKFAII